MKMVKIYCDGANLSDFEKYSTDNRIEGFTTNPSILKKAGIKDYRTFAKNVLGKVRDKPVSFEVLSDDWNEMERQAKEIQSWGNNVWVKIPIMNTLGEPSTKLISKLSDVNLNVTAVMTYAQIDLVSPFLKQNDILSVFVGRITDTQSPVPTPNSPTHKWLWASTREVYSVKRATILNYDIITLTPDLINKLSLTGKNLTDYSLETVSQFHQDGKGIQL